MFGAGAGILIYDMVFPLLEIASVHQGHDPWCLLVPAGAVAAGAPVPDFRGWPPLFRCPSGARWCLPVPAGALPAGAPVPQCHGCPPFVRCPSGVRWCPSLGARWCPGAPLSRLAAVRPVPVWCPLVPEVWCPLVPRCGDSRSWPP